MEQLIQKAVVTVPLALIAETIALMAILSGRSAARRLSTTNLMRPRRVAQIGLDAGRAIFEPQG